VLFRSGNSKLTTWWGNLLGDGKVFDTSKYFIICANVLGSCYGSSGPNSINPTTNTLYGNTFPDVTIRDTVSLHMEMLKQSLHVNKVHCVIGGSMGGMQALEWAIIGGDYVKAAVVIGCGAEHSAWQIAIGEAQRQAIYADTKWNNGDIDMSDPPLKGLSVARQIAMISYRTAIGYHNKFSREKDEKGVWQVKKYLEYQGLKFLDRFDAVSYVKITEQMDSHDVGRGRGGLDPALGSIHPSTRVLVMGIDSDVLYPLTEQLHLASKIANAEFRVINSVDGHDGFLLEQQQVAKHIEKFL